LLLAEGCGPQLPIIRPTLAPLPLATFIIPTVLPNGRADVTIRTSYVLGTSAVIPVTLSASRGTITGPVAARILASGIGGRFRPSEVLVKALPVTPASAAAGQIASTSVSWDGRDDKGDAVPADAYSLVLDFRITDGSIVTTATAGATLQWNAP
jgi:hypothetical protein